MRRRLSDEMEATAIHEAAHAVVAHVLGLRVTRASITADNCAVLTVARKSYTPLAKASTLEKFILVDLAGQAAETQLGDAKLSGTTDDIATGSRIDEANAEQRALQLILLSHRLPEDTESTDALQTEAKVLVDDLRSWAAALVAQNWPTIERVAAALLEHDYLDEDKLEVIAGRRGITIR